MGEHLSTMFAIEAHSTFHTYRLFLPLSLSLHCHKTSKSCSSRAKLSKWRLPHPSTITLLLHTLWMMHPHHTQKNQSHHHLRPAISKPTVHRVLFEKLAVRRDPFEFLSLNICLRTGPFRNQHQPSTLLRASHIFHSRLIRGPVYLQNYSQSWFLRRRAPSNKMSKQQQIRPLAFPI